MLKIFHNNFFENLSDPIPPFFTTKKFGLLIYLPIVYWHTYYNKLDHNSYSPMNDVVDNLSDQIF